MTRRILILDGHPDPDAARFVHSLAAAYREGAEAGGHEVLAIRVADVDFPLLRTQADYEKGEPVEAVRRCQSAFDWATHVVILYPLWLGSMPALLKGLLEQMLRPGFAWRRSAGSNARISSRRCAPWDATHAEGRRRRPRMWRLRPTRR
jgi:putative NADPH-quinone reductase